MKKNTTLDILNAVKAGTLSPEEALTKLKMEPIDDMGQERTYCKTRNS